MKFCRFAILLLAASATVGVSLAAPQEFLIPVDPLEEAEQELKNDRFLKEEGYFASRYRIVRVNTNLLESADQMTISFFDDVSIVAQVHERKIDSQGYSIAWEGQLVNPPISAKFLEDQGIAPEQADSIHSNMFRILIGAVKHDYDEVNDLSFPSYSPHDTAVQSESLSTFYDVTAYFSVSSLPANYRLVSLENDRRYHVLLEIDPEKIFPPGPIDDIENPELGRRRQLYKDFVDALGEKSNPLALKSEDSP